MADQTADGVKPPAARNGAGFKPGAIIGAVCLSLALLPIFDLVSHTHF
jgi:hypothetical protein